MYVPYNHQPRNEMEHVRTAYLQGRIDTSSIGSSTGEWMVSYAKRSIDLTEFRLPPHPRFDDPLTPLSKQLTDIRWTS